MQHVQNWRDGVWNAVIRPVDIVQLFQSSARLEGIKATHTSNMLFGLSVRFVKVEEELKSLWCTLEESVQNKMTSCLWFLLQLTTGQIIICSVS